MGLRLLAVACLVGAAFAGPYQRQSQCATRCSKPLNEKFNYEPGKKYVYDYHGVNFMVVAGQKKQKAEMSGQAEIHVNTKCDMVLKLKNIRLQQKAKQEEIDDLVRQLEIPLPFSYEDGKIDHVCPSSQETQHSQNIKRGLLSTFINTMNNLKQSQEVKEVDSLGTCLTAYTVKSSQEPIIEKEKDLKSCTNRHSSLTSLMSKDYENPDSDIHTLPIFPEEKLVCTQEYENNILKSCKCKEFSSIRPLAKHASIIEFEGQMELSLRQVDRAENLRIPSHSGQEPILYNLKDDTSVEDREQEVVESLRKMCAKNTGTIDISVSKDFIELVSSVKRLSYEPLQRIYSSLETSRLCSSKKLTDLFLDTLPMAGSDAAIKLMADLLVQHKVTGPKAKLWSASLALVSHPSQEAISAVVPLIQNQKTSAVLLGVSAMVYRYCSKVSCENSRPVREIVSTLNEILGRQCSCDKESEAIAVLKAFGNMGQLLQAEQNVLACAKDSDKSIRLRLAAIDAFRRLEKKRPESLLKLYSDPQEHYEIRIAALAAVLKKADRKQLQTIKEVAERESHEQVSAYAASLISNMNKTSSPLKKPVKHLLREIQVQPPKVGYWENSKNIELSTFSETFNVGGSFESDIIHSPKSKIPRSVYTRFDLDVFDKHINLFEVGIRAEGLEAAFQKLIGLHESKKQKSSWNFLQSSNDIEDDKTEASFFFRAMNTEVLDLSVGDLTSMREMVNFANVLTKISHDKSADFSHSFMFMNSKVIIPSVTGRSYSFGLTGSATVGLTASSKVDIVDIMSKPKNCDVHGHFQPSVNVELAATVGIHSSKPRPDVKIVTRMHSEADIEAQFKIKDGHVGLVKVATPSENIVLSSISSDIVEIDAHHQERRLYETMQKKIDYCFDQLEKPLGVSVCGKWEVPRPFLSKTFPFVKGVGNVELSIKKTDPGMRGYEMSFEIPKHKSQLMKYSASLSTPGSRINRRFSADLEVRTPSREQKQFSLQLQSPFQSASLSASGSLTTRQDLIDGSAELQYGSKKYSVRGASTISQSGSQKTYKPSIQFSSPSSSQPMKVDGTITVTKERKEQISFDLKCNKPSRKPLMIKGTIVKEGRVSTSKNAEWKLSSDLAVKSPLGNMQIRSSAEKQSRQAQTISTAFSVEYQKERSQRQSVKLSAKLQQSSSKLSSSAQFECTEYPSTNFALTWNMQGKLRESVKNDITLKYGRDPESQYINILHSSRLFAQPGECRIAVKAPEFKIDSDLTITHDIEKNSRIHAECDLRYKEDKHVKAKLHLDNLSERPLKLKVKAEIETPSRRMMYQDEVEETSPNMYKGNAVLEWRAGRKAELQYRYSKLSSSSKLHHEIETSLRMPNSRSPIKNKASIKLSPESFALEGRVSLDRRSDYSLKAHLNKRGTSHVSLKMPKIEGNLKVVNDGDKKGADLDVKINLFRRPRHVIASTTLGLGSQKKFETELCLDADNKPDQKYVLSSTYEKRSRNQYSGSTKLQISDKASIEISSSGDLGIYGSHEASVQASLLRQEPVGLMIRHEMSSTRMNTVMKVSKNQRPKVELTFGGERLKKGREIELSASASVKSLDNSFQTKRWSSSHTYSRSGSSLTLKSNLKCEWSPSKVYESEINYDFQPNIVLLKAYLHTPHLNFEKQSIGFSFRKSGSMLVTSASLEIMNGKTIAITSETQSHSGSLSSSLVITSPFEVVKDAKMQVSLVKQGSEKSFKSSIDVNGERKADAEFSLIYSSVKKEITGRVQTTFTPEIFTRITIQNSLDSFKYDIQVRKGSTSLMSSTASKQVSGQQYSYAFQATSQGESLVNIKMAKEMSPQGTKHMLEAQGPFPQLSAYIESSRTDKNSLSVGVKACKESCYSVKGYHKILKNEDNYRFYRKVTFEVEKTTGNSRSERLAHVHIIGSIKENDYREKFIVEMKEKKVGYEVRFHLRENEQDHCSLDSHIFMPLRTLRLRGSALHNAKSVLLDFEIVPDAAVPSRKLGFELKKENEDNEISGYVKLLYPGMRNAIQLSGRIQKEGKFPVGGNMKLDYSSIGGKVLNLEITPEHQGRRNVEKKSVMYKLYSEDKEIDISAKLTKHITSEESSYGYEWSYISKQGPKEGKVLLKISGAMSRKPEVVELEVITTSVSTKLSSRITWGIHLPTAIHLDLQSQSQSFVAVDFKVEDNCLVLDETLNSRPFMNHKLCIGGDNDEKMVLAAIQSYYKRRPIFDFSIEVDPEHSHVLGINLNWDERNFRQSMREFRQVISEIQSRYLSNEDLEYIVSVLRHIEEVLKQAIRDASEHFMGIFDYHYQIMNLNLKNVKSMSISTLYSHVSSILPLDYIKNNIIKPFVEAIRCLSEKYVDYFQSHIPEVMRALWEETKKEIIDCMYHFCPKDSICYEMATVMEHFELEKAKMVLLRRVDSLKKSLHECLDSVTLPEVREWIARTARVIREQIRSVFGSFFEGRLARMFVDYARRIEKVLSEKLQETFEEVFEWILNIITHAEQDEDFQILKSLVNSTKEKAMRAWKNKETLLHDTWHPLRESIEDYPKNWLKERMNIRTFSPKEGNIKIELRHPFKRKHIQILKNALLKLKARVLSMK